MKQNTTAIYDVDTLNILSPDKIGLTETESGYLEFSYDGRDYEKVDLTRLVPFNDENRYISVSYKNEEDEWKEIGEQIFEGELASLKRFKDDVKEVKAGYECGLVFDGFNDVKEEDKVEAYIMVEVPR